MNLAVWAERDGVARVTACRWFDAGLLPVAAQRVGRLIFVNDAAAEMAGHGWTAVYAWVSSADQKADLDRQVARVTAWATAEQISVDKVVTEVGSSLRCCATCRWAGSWWSIGMGSAGSALNTSKPRSLPRAVSWVVVDSAEVDDDLVRDMTEILTRMCVRLYGKRAAANRAERAFAAAADAGEREVA